MFWRKARKIREQAEIIEAYEQSTKTTSGKMGELSRQVFLAEEKIVGLTADRDGTRDSIVAFERSVKAQQIELEMLRAERDQFAKRVEDLQEQIKEMGKIQRADREFIDKNVIDDHPA